MPEGTTIEYAPETEAKATTPPSVQAGAAHAVACYDSFDAVPAAQLELIAYPAQDNLFLSAQWYRCLAAYGFSRDLPLRIYVANDAVGHPACFLFCAADRRCGTLRGLSNFYTMEFAPVFPGGEPDLEVLRALARYIAAERPRWRRIQLPFLRADRPATALLGVALAEESFVINRYYQFENWYCGTEGMDFEAYYDQRPSRLKNTIRRKEKKMRAEHDIEIAIHETVADHMIADWEAIYVNSWKGKEQFPDFVPNLMRACAGLGILRYGALHFDGAPAAAQIWINSGRRTIIYKLAYDEKFSNWSVGSVLTRDLMCRAIDGDGMVEVDYGVGSEPYKRDWMTGCRDIIGIEGFNSRSLAGFVLALRWLLAALVKRLRAQRSADAD